MRSSILKLAILAALGTITSAAAQVAKTPQQGLTDFLERIDGSTDIKILDLGNQALKNPTAQFVNDTDMLGMRFFKSNRHSDPMGDARRARAAFDAECVAVGGTVEPDGGSLVRFQLRWASSKLPKETRFVAYRSLASICTRGAVSLGGIVALVEDHSAFVKASQDAPLMRNIAPIENRTVVYAVRASAVVSQTEIDRVTQRDRGSAARDAELAAFNRASMEKGRRDAESRLIAWRKTIAVGMHTICGLVIDVRGPVVQVQLPADTTFSGTRVHWIERDQLADIDARHECRF